MVRQGRMPSNPLQAVEKGRVQGREVRRRRAYTDDELQRLLAVAGKRRPVYLTAVLTGIRHGELKALRWGDFDLDSDRPSVTVRASVSKNHKQACLPLHPNLVIELRRFRSVNTSAGDLVFGRLVPRSKVVRAHLAAASIVNTDSEGRTADFHSLRHTFCTNLHRAGVSQREAMELMRHSDARLTAKTYTDASLLPLKAAVEKLQFPSPGGSAGQASQGASQDLVPEGHSVSQVVTTGVGRKLAQVTANAAIKAQPGT
ncbi:MAG: site-specific integrase, partial [Verrucomicrobia bacterium]|nr:site-specific integrase [Verrucomicrobiota bacterium]